MLTEGSHAYLRLYIFSSFVMVSLSWAKIKELHTLLSPENVQKLPKSKMPSLRDSHTHKNKQNQM